MKDSTYRNENKFIIDYAQATVIKEQISAICLLDNHVGENGFYDIKSVYFDTIDDRFYYENLSGIDVRHKYRIRIYNNDASIINLERKATEAGLKHKDSSKLSYKQVEEIIGGNIMIDVEKNQQVLHEFQAEHLCSFLLPKAIVRYRRIPYIHPIGNVRITFDYNICASDECDRFFDEDVCYHTIIDEEVLVLEVKYDELLPGAIREILNANGLFNQTAFSKYSLAREMLESYEN